MIICPKHRFLFVHIPKCAGTSIRLQLRECDDTHIFLGRTGTHPVLGKLDYAHIPLHQLREHFPEHYAYLGEFESFAVVRDPLERFGSALRQVLWQYEKRPMTLIAPEELREMTLNMLDKVHGEIDAPSHRYIFFTRQSDYIYDEGQRLIDHLVPVDLAGGLLGYLSERTGVALDADRRSNQNVDMRFKRLGGLAYRVNAALRRTLPSGLHARVKGVALKVLATKKSAAETSGVLDIPEVQEFVTQHYQQDAEIYRAVIQDGDQLKAALRAGTLASGKA